MAGVRRRFQRNIITAPDRAPWFTCILRGEQLEYAYINEAYYNSFGRKEFVGSSVFTIMAEMNDQVFFNLLRKVYETGIRHVGKDPIWLGNESRNEQARQWVDYTYTPVMDNGGSVVEIIVEGQVLARKMLQQSAWQIAEEKGINRLTDAELLSIFLGDKSTDRSQDLLHRLGSLRSVIAFSFDTKQKPSGLDAGATFSRDVIAILRVRAAVEIYRRAMLQKIKKRQIISCYSLLCRYLNLTLSNEHIEQFRVLFIDSASRLIADEKMSGGTFNRCAVYPREILRKAIELSATAIILVHNHPSTRQQFSAPDIEITRNLIAAAAALEIEVHDHLLVAGHAVKSLRQTGHWPG